MTLYRLVLDGKVFSFQTDIGLLSATVFNTLLLYILLVLDIILVLLLDLALEILLLLLLVVLDFFWGLGLVIVLPVVERLVRHPLSYNIIDLRLVVNHS